MTTIDCAYDEEMADKLVEYLNSEEEEGEGEYSATKEKDAHVLTRNKITKKTLDKFLAESGIEGYNVMLSEPDMFILAKKTSVEDFGLAQCEICGFVAFDEELFAHRRAHGL